MGIVAPTANDAQSFRVFKNILDAPLTRTTGHSTFDTANEYLIAAIDDHGEGQNTVSGQE